MSPAFQKTLQGNSVTKEIKPMSFFGKFIELNKVMYTSSANLKATHPDSSTWYEWPFDKKPIWYWTQAKDNLKANIYLVGNPAVWWLIIVSIPVIISNLSDKHFSRKTIFWIYILFLGFFANIVPFIFMKRVVFLYHYLISLVFGVLALTLFIDKDLRITGEREEKPYKIKKCLEKGKKIKNEGFFAFPSKSSFFLYSGYLLIVFLVFILLSPLSYGNFLSGKINSFYSSLIKFLH
jgi:dolichyl-phosphate-mannose--protein O-mannosyl transferase